MIYNVVQTMDDETNNTPSTTRHTGTYMTRTTSLFILLECPLYTGLRNIVLQVCYTNIEDFANMDQEDTFIESMKSKDDNIIAVLGKYLHKTMTKRCWSNLNAPPNHKRRKRCKKNKP